MKITHILGIIVIAIGFGLSKSDSPARPYSGAIKIIGFILLLIGSAISSVVQVEPGEVGVQKLFGKVSSKILESGLNVINPLVEVVSFDIILFFNRIE